MTTALLAAFRVAGLGLALVLLAAWLVQPVPFAVKALPVSVALLSALRPAAGLIVLAGLGPMANAISLWSHSPLPGIRLLEQLVIAVVFGAGLRWWTRGTKLRLAEAAALLSASAVASFVSVQPALVIRRLPEAAFGNHLRDLLWNGEYFVRSSLWDPLFFAALTVEGLALAVTVERIVRRDAGAAVSTIRMAVLGHTGVAALNLQQILGAAIRTGDVWRELPRVLRDVRVSLFYDVNAAGSVFLLMLLGGTGLLRASTRFAWEIALLLLVVAAGLWIAGSRAALLALAVTMIAMLCLAAWRRRGTARLIAAGGIVVILVAGGTTALFYPAARNASVGPAAGTRRIMAQTSVNMWRAAPVFGVGVGRFYEESSRFGAYALRQELGFVTINENAHNYFFQVLATEGLVGLAALLATLGVILVPAIVGGPHASPSLGRWLAAGIVAYLLTWLTGHPQLVPEASFAFWLTFGVLAGLTSPPRGAWWRRALAIAAVIVLVTAPFRAAHTIRQADLEHVAIGLSHWQPEIDGFRYRLAGASFELYLPGDGTAVDLPLRRAPAASDPLVVSISVDGQKLYEPLVSGDAWQQIRVQLPKTNRRFVLVRFDVDPLQPGGTSVLFVGRADRR